MTSRALVLIVTVLFVVAVAPLDAHEMTVMGTVAQVESARIQVKTGKEKKGEAPSWYPIDEKTVVKRGTRTVAFTDARIKVDERVVLLVDHPTKGPVKTKEIRLSAQSELQR